ncbi:MAG: hypothetical protein SGI74_02170 [Oligoflexia bacterium]|nr:hypothetical protein [Oligoflexia bacterium]
MSDLSTWVMLVATGVSAVATVVSALAAWRMWKVSESTLNLQASVEVTKKPLVHIWYNGTQSLTPKVFGGMTIINIGKESLPVRRLRILGNGRQSLGFKLLDPTLLKVKRYSPEDLDKYQPKFEQEATDFVLSPTEIFQASIEIDSSQLTLEVMYYDNSFEFIEIDTSNLGGKYILTGQGRK